MSYVRVRFFVYFFFFSRLSLFFLLFLEHLFFIGKFSSLFFSVMGLKTFFPIVSRGVAGECGFVELSSWRNRFLVAKQIVEHGMRRVG